MVVIRQPELFIHSGSQMFRNMNHIAHGISLEIYISVQTIHTLHGPKFQFSEFIIFSFVQLALSPLYCWQRKGHWQKVSTQNTRLKMPKVKKMIPWQKTIVMTSTNTSIAEILPKLNIKIKKLSKRISLYLFGTKIKYLQ